jgi:hypothetical protein
MVGLDAYSHQAVKGTQEPSDEAGAERQQSEWTGRWLCVYQRAGAKSKAAKLID